MDMIIKTNCPKCKKQIIADFIPNVNSRGIEYIFYCDKCKKKFLIKEFET